MRATSLLPLLAGLTLAATPAAGLSFSDDFNAGASIEWRNERGMWAAAGGVYDAAAPSNAPVTFSSLGFLLGDFVLELDVNDIDDGGVWLRSDFNGGNVNGVLLVTGGNGGSGTGFYWHTFQNGGASGKLNEVAGLFTNGVSDVQLRIEVTGDHYAVFLNGAGTPATTLDTNLFASGRVALYDFSGQTFDDVSLVPEPAWLAWLAAGLAAARAWRAAR